MARSDTLACGPFGPVGCGGKRIYDTFKAARDAARRTRRGREARSSAYHCVACHHFHVGEAGRTAGMDRRRELMRRAEAET